MPRINNELPKGFELQGNSRKYTILKKLGAGGFGITYKVKAPVTVGTIRMTANFCVKEFFPASDCERLADSRINYSNPARERVENARRDFVSEALRLKKIGFTHHNIVGFDEVFEANNTAYYVMEFVEGKSLQEYVAGKGSLSEEETRALMWPILDAMRLLHKNHICHLDIKPGNIMLGQEEDGGIRPVLIDFGLSKHYDKAGRPTTTVKTLGVSEGYSPREQYSGLSSFSPESDIYALGATLWYCLTGKQPKSSLVLRDGELASELPGNISPEMHSLVEQMTRDIHTRPRSIEELNIGGNPAKDMTDGKESGNSAPTVSTDTVMINAARRSDDKKPWVRYAVIAAAAAVIGVAAIFAIKSLNGDNGKADETPTIGTEMAEPIPQTDTPEEPKTETPVEEKIPVEEVAVSAQTTENPAPAAQHAPIQKPKPKPTPQKPKPGNNENEPQQGKSNSGRINNTTRPETNNF